MDVNVIKNEDKYLKLLTLTVSIDLDLLDDFDSWGKFDFNGLQRLFKR